MKLNHHQSITTKHSFWKSRADDSEQGMVNEVYSKEIFALDNVVKTKPKKSVPKPNQK